MVYVHVKLDPLRVRKYKGSKKNKNEFSDISQMKKAIKESKQPGYFFPFPTFFLIFVCFVFNLFPLITFSFLNGSERTVGKEGLCCSTITSRSSESLH